jgi:hypothetical protein
MLLPLKLGIDAPEIAMSWMKLLLCCVTVTTTPVDVFAAISACPPCSALDTVPTKYTCSFGTIMTEVYGYVHCTAFENLCSYVSVALASALFVALAFVTIELIAQVVAFVRFPIVSVWSPCKFDDVSVVPVEAPPARRNWSPPEALTLSVVIDPSFVATPVVTVVLRLVGSCLMLPTGIVITVWLPAAPAAVSHVIVTVCAAEIAPRETVNPSSANPSPSLAKFGLKVEKPAKVRRESAAMLCTNVALGPFDATHIWPGPSATFMMHVIAFPPEGPRTNTTPAP